MKLLLNSLARMADSSVPRISHGKDESPLLLHGYYKPGHHSDMAFVRAIEYGSPQNHWNLRDMKPAEGIDKQQADAIIQFVRWHQRESGLY